MLEQMKAQNQIVHYRVEPPNDVFIQLHSPAEHINVNLVLENDNGNEISQEKV